MANKMINCKSCGAEIAASAKTCPKCGAKNKKPIYKRWWVYVLAVVILFAAIGGSGNSGNSGNSGSSGKAAAPAKTESVSQSKPTPEPIEYTHYKVTELFDAMKGNAMKAQNTFKGQYVELEGYLGTIDSDGKYIGLGAGEGNYDYIFDEVHCYLKTEEQKTAVMEMNKGDSIIVRGKITDVGEVLGFYLNIDSFG